MIHLTRELTGNASDDAHLSFGIALQYRILPGVDPNAEEGPALNGRFIILADSFRAVLPKVEAYLLKVVEYTPRPISPSQNS